MTTAQKTGQPNTALVTTWLVYQACRKCKTGTLEFSRRRMYGDVHETEARCVNCGRLWFMDRNDNPPAT